MVTSPVASRLPSLRRRASATRSRAAGLRKKLMLRLMVTANGTGPTAASTATYMAKSASAIMVGPEIVPPGRTETWRNACRTRQPRFHTASIVRPLSGIEGLRKLGEEKALELLDCHRHWHIRRPPAATELDDYRQMKRPAGAELASASGATRSSSWPHLRINGAAYTRSYHALPNCLRSSSFARINVLLREAGRFLPARLM